MTSAPDPAGSGSEHTDVAIVGAGPVGLTLANFLGLYGVRTVVLESRPTLIDYPRGVGMDDETLRTFQGIGVVQDVLPHTTPDQWLRFMNSKGRCFASIEPRSRQFGWPRRNAFIQPLVDEVLLAGLDRFDGVEVRWDSEVVSVDDGPDAVRYTVREGHQEKERTASYLVGCDGGRSIVRKEMGVSWDGTSSPTRWLVVDLAHDPVGTPNACVYGDWHRPYVSIALPHGLRRFEFMLLAGEDEDEMAKPDRVDELIRAVVPDVGPIDYIRQRVYTHHARVAGSFVQGRVLIGGDAAHLMPVWQGQGYNSGIRDAANLGWKLAAAIKGEASPRIIQTYDTERRAHAAAMVKISQTAGLLVRQTKRSSAMARDAITRVWDFVPPFKRYIVEMRYKPMPRYTEGVVLGASDGGPPGSGRLFIQPTVATRHDGRRMLDEVLGPWFAVLAWGDDPRAHLGPEGVEALRRLRARVVVARPPTQLHWGEPDEDGYVVVADDGSELKNWFDAQGGSIAVVRPDRFVAAVCRPLELSARLARLAELIGAPSATGTAVTA
jgi:3-(3-hydroxy-phenyl)propionate hydroxylase